MNRRELQQKVAESFDRLLTEKSYVSAIDIFAAIGKLTDADIENWRCRRILFLEEAVVGNFSTIGLILRSIRLLSTKAGLRPRRTAYHGWGKARSIPLRFSEHGDPLVEEAWTAHYVEPSARSKPPLE